MNTEELIYLLLQQSKEIAEAGHPGWGNTMLAAAERLREISDDLDGMTAAAESLQQDVYTLIDDET